MLSAETACSRCTHLIGAALFGFATAIAAILLLGPEIQSLRRTLLLKLQNQHPLDPVESREESLSVAIQHLRQQPPLGIIGGSGAEAGIDLASKVVAASQRQMAALPDYAAFSADLTAPRFSLLSVPELGLSMDMARHEAQVWASLREAYLELAGAPAPTYSRWASCNATCESPVVGEPRTGVIAIACVTLAYFEPKLEQLRVELLRSPFWMLAAPPPKLVSYPAAVGRRVAARFPHVKTVALLGSELTLDVGTGGKSPFNCAARERDVAAADHCGDWVYEVPTMAAQKRLQKLIFSIKRGQGAQGGVLHYKDDLKHELFQLIDGMRSELVVLACTELPLLLTEKSTSGEVSYGGKILLDATTVLAEELAASVLPLPKREISER